MSSGPLERQPVVRIRPAERRDAGQILQFIHDLAEYERAPEKVLATPELIERALFGEDPAAEAIIAEDEEGRALGFALFYRTFSTWEGVPGLWLEDLYVPPEHRRGGLGRKLLERLAAIAVERGYTRLEWTALNWNTPALAFYEGLGAEVMDEWLTHRLDGEALQNVGRPA